jgi:hypothetical protein
MWRKKIIIRKTTMNIRAEGIEICWNVRTVGRMKRNDVPNMEKNYEKIEGKRVII